jgi:hypothetical protein
LGCIHRIQRRWIHVIAARAKILTIGTIQVALFSQVIGDSQGMEHTICTEPLRKIEKVILYVHISGICFTYWFTNGNF